MMPMKVPIRLQRTVSQKWRKVSFTPSKAPRLSRPAGSWPAIEVPRATSSMISGMAKMPTSTGTRSSPCQR